MNPLRTLLLTLAITTSGACAAQDTQRDETQIAALLDRYETALNASDVDAVLELYDPEALSAGALGSTRCDGDRSIGPRNLQQDGAEPLVGDWI